ncbi:MAG: SpoIIE family protein phosphatase, partial [Selenomonadaceae bacterium]|nr:SpoIIE family protein phosphatase [Selenomonadaceae bacterium]
MLKISMKAGMKLKLERLGIRKQVIYLLLAACFITLIVAGAITLFGMMKIKSEAVQIGIEIGTTAAQNSSEALRKVSMESMQMLTRDRAQQLSSSFINDMAWGVIAMANEMNKILSEPEEYSPRRVSPPNAANAGKLTAQLQYKAGVNRAALAYEVGLSANIQDFQIRLYDEDPTIASVYIASVKGFNITTDRVSNTRVDENNNPLPNDYSTRPWYQNAMREGKLTITDVFVDAHGRGLAIGCSAPYFDANGKIAGVVGEGRMLNDVSEIVKETKIGETGFSFVLNNETGQVLFSPKTEGDFAIDNDGNLLNDSSLFDIEDKALAETAQKMAAGETGINLVNIDGKSCYLAYAPIEGPNWSFGTVLEESEVIIPATLSKEQIEDNTYNFVEVLNYSIKLIIIAIIIAFIIIVALVPFAGQKIADKLTKPILNLSDGVREIASGNFDKKLDIHTGNEIEHLATCFNAMTDELKTYMANLTKVTADKERIATELNVATNIQISMLPRDFDFNRDDFEIYATMNAAKAVGGDFYDFYLLDENHLMITIADVSGKGVPAALFMSRSKTILKNFATMMTNPDDLASVTTLSNNQLCQGNDEMMFVTVFMGMLDLQSGKFIFVNGGHNPPMVYHKATDKFEYMKVKQNIVLGMMDDMDFEQQEIQLEAGDILYLYTDGVTEAMDIDNNQYGEERLSDCLNNVDKNADLPTILQKVREDLTKHVGEAEQSD